ncbi:MAG: polyprenyl synthetase family protein [Bacteroidales bacterium]|nr:polyprenyl synthetase family protein [Bacteroidales bacterium]MDD4361553.1 polyprenyl synthetase family protein [Bacteroidales bacterium]
MKSIQEISTLVHNGIREIDFPDQPSGLYEPLQYVLGLGGKRLRPLLCLSACNLFNEEALAQALPLALGIELFHNFTLIHDDLMDRSLVRRNKATVHIKWNENTAVLSGDALQIMACQQIALAPADKLKDCLDLFNQTASEVCEGQQLDMNFEMLDNVSKEDYIEMIRLKTAVLLGCSLKLGAIAGGAPARAADLLYDFGIHLGIAFQIQDDLLDVYGDPDIFGKAIGGDIINNKKTFLWIHSMETADDHTRSLFLNCMKSSYMDREEKIKMVTSFYNRLGARESCEQQMLDHQQSALKALNKLGLDKEQLITLSELARKLTYRQV